MSTAPLRLGIQLQRFRPPDGDARALLGHHVEVARTAEAAGFDTLWVMDHVIGLDAEREPDAWLPEGNMLLAALAGHTTTIALGLLVGAVTFRNPAWHAKATTTLDVLSGGRAVHGLGAAWHEPEHHAYGIPFPPLAERMDRLGEALAIAGAMFTEAEPSFEGRHYRIDGARNDPRPLRGDIPILVGGQGRRRTLRLVAEHADASNFGGSPAKVAELVGVLERHCHEVGREPAEIVKTVGGVVLVGRTHEEARRRRDEHRAATSIPPEVYEDAVIWGSPDEIAERVAGLLAAGGDGFLATVPDPFDLEAIDLIGRAVAPLVGLEPASTR